jgi:hypothetical protein
MRFLAVGVIAVSVAIVSEAQELTPNAYGAAPTGVNFVGVANAFNHGDIAFDPSGPIEDGRASINTTVFTWGRTFGAAGRLANILVAVPAVAGHLEGLYLGEFQQVDRYGLADPQVRIAVNLHGVPALPLKEFARQDRTLVVGASVTTVVPLGRYDSSKLINIGTNRWSFKPEVGIWRKWGKWALEAYAGTWLFTRNDDFFGGRVRTQKALFSSQFHVEYTFRPRMWLAFNSNFYTGGRTAVNNQWNIDLQRNSRVGVTWAVPAGARHGFRFAVSRGAFTTIGAAFTSLGTSYQYTWGGGL